MKLTKTSRNRSSLTIVVASVLFHSLSTAQQLPPPPLSPSPAWKYEYDAEGNPTKTTAAPGSRNFITAQQFDNLGRLNSITDPKQGVAAFSYDLSDSLKAVADPGKVSVKYQVNGFGDVLKRGSTDAGTSSITYDAIGNIKTRKDARGVVASFDYDELSRLKQLVFSAPNAPSRTTNWTYDQVGADFGYGVGRLTTAASPEVTTTMRYDALGRVTMAIQNAQVSLSGQRIPLVVNTDYDGVGHTLGLVYPSGRTVAYAWSGGQPSAISLNIGNGSTLLLDQISVSPIGQIKKWTWQLGGIARGHERFLDADGRLIRYPLGNLIRDVRYDDADRISSFTHYIASTGQVAPSYDQTFGYDELNRLITVSGATSWSYSYDPNGNRTSMTTGSAPTRDFAITFDTNRLSSMSNPSRTLNYDAIGNILSDTQAGASTNYSAVYSLEGRLSEMSQGTTGLVKFFYDAFGRRVVRVEGTATTSVTVYAYDNANHLIGEYKVDGTPISEYVWLGDTPVAVIKGSGATTEVFAVHADHLDTPRMLMDSQWRVRWRWVGEPFGSSAAEEQPTANVAAVQNNLRFPGHQYEGFGGRHYNHFRDYDPTTGRYVQSDPIGLNGGFNTYAYAYSNPLSFTDPSGLQVPMPPPPLPLPGVPNPTEEANRALAEKLQRMLERSRNRDDEPKLTYQTYTRYNPKTGKCYSGRTSGYDDPEMNVLRRSYGQPLLNAEGFEPPVLDRSSESYSAIRGREQRLIEVNGGAQSANGTSRNMINGISPWNPRRPFYLNDALTEFGDPIPSKNCTCK